MPGSTPESRRAAPPPIDDAAQRRKEFRQPMDLIQDDELILRVVEKERGLRQTVAVVAVLEVEIERVSSPADLQSQRGLADLPRADQGNSGLPLQGAINVAGDETRDHCPCNLSTSWRVCKDMLAFDCHTAGTSTFLTRFMQGSALNLDDEQACRHAMRQQFGEQAAEVARAEDLNAGEDFGHTLRRSRRWQRCKGAGACATTAA